MRKGGTSSVGEMVGERRGKQTEEVNHRKNETKGFLQLISEVTIAKKIALEIEKHMSQQTTYLHFQSKTYSAPDSYYCSIKTNLILSCAVEELGLGPFSGSQKITAG